MLLPTLRIFPFPENEDHDKGRGLSFTNKFYFGIIIACDFIVHLIISIIVIIVWEHDKQKFGSSTPARDPAHDCIRFQNNFLTTKCWIFISCTLCLVGGGRRMISIKLSHLVQILRGDEKQNKGFNPSKCHFTISQKIGEI